MLIMANVVTITLFPRGGLERKIQGTQKKTPKKKPKKKDMIAVAEGGACQRVIVTYLF